MSIEIICPLYNASNYIENLHKSLLNQKEIEHFKITYILTESNDSTKKYLLDNKLSFKEIKKKDFSHSLVRENAAKECKADIIVFISQDIVIEDELWLYYLTKDIINGTVDAAFSRQITKYNNIEKYTREKNYPNVSRIVSKDNIPELGLNTFFFSDASSAISRKVFKELNYYDNKNLPINEDMYIAYKLIMNDKKIKYCADSVVYHSHNFKLKELYDRYKLTGQFFKQNSYLDEFGTGKAGGGLAKYVLKRAIQEKNVKVIFRFIPDMAVRYIGMKVGKK